MYKVLCPPPSLRVEASVLAARGGTWIMLGVAASVLAEVRGLSSLLGKNIKFGRGEGIRVESWQFGSSIVGNIFLRA